MFYVMNITSISIYCEIVRLSALNNVLIVLVAPLEELYQKQKRFLSYDIILIESKKCGTILLNIVPVSPLS